MRYTVRFGWGAMKDYAVPPWVRVRREEFGLLFYDTRDTVLTFVRSGSSLDAPSFTGLERRLGVQCESERRERAVSRLLEKLEAKGLVIAVEPE